MHTDHDHTAEVLSRRLHLLVDDVTEQPDALDRILADTVHDSVVDAILNKRSAILDPK